MLGPMKMQINSSPNSTESVILSILSKFL